MIKVSTPEQEQRLRQLVSEGKLATEIAGVVGWPRWRVYNVLRRMGLKIGNLGGGPLRGRWRRPDRWRFTREHARHLFVRYRAGETVTTLARELGRIHPNTIYRAFGRHCGWKRKEQTWRVLHKSGYVQVWTGTGYALEHRKVMAEMIGRPLEDWETVHHINGDRQDNRPINLQLRQGRHGKGVVLMCRACGSSDIVPTRI
jgi:hypothetical protein